MNGPACLDQWRDILLLAALLAFLAACGVKTPPYPEEATLPAPVLDLSQAIADSGELILSWRPPEKNMVGRQLKEIGGFEIQMADNVLTESYCLGCPHQYQTVDRLPAAGPPPGLVLAPGPYTWRYRVQPGHVYHFRVYPLAVNGGRHPQAVSETVVWAVAPPGQLGFSAALGDKAVELRWNRPGRDYLVEIEKKGPGGQWAPLAGLDQASGAFSDLAVAYGQSCSYRGRLVRVKDETRARGPWSTERTVRVIDLTPPPPPGHLDAALDVDGVRLNWENVAFEPDLAGYRLYRRIEGEAGFTRIGPDLIRGNSYRDPIRQRGGESVRYQVTAVDSSPQANESQPSPTADVYLDPPVSPEPRP
ncbi:MAG: lipoprotein [Candidatus Adiutrix sp.]|jgi:hypothetical protein|nr:lipoprotein [Candidatus Adiutrix sp.]